MDDTFVIHKEANKQGFLQHINSVDLAIRFTVEDNKEDGSIPFLDTIVKPEVDGSLSITVYRKPTHTDQYLQWDSHHHLSAKFSVIHLVQSPFRIFAVGESLPGVLFFFLEQLRIGAHSGGPVGEGLDNTEFGWEVMVTVPL